MGGGEVRADGGLAAEPGAGVGEEVVGEEGIVEGGAPAEEYAAADGPRALVARSCAAATRRGGWSWTWSLLVLARVFVGTR